MIPDYDYWQKKCNELTLDGRALIGGKRRENGESCPVISPIDQQAIAQLTLSDPEMVDEAVARARASFERGDWSGKSPAERKWVLWRYADLLESHREELALLDSLETGKPIQYTYAHDMEGAIRCIRYYAEAVDKVYGEVAPTTKNALALVTREAIGVVGAILPWNFPQLMLAWKLGPALAAGNSVVVKPSEKSSLSTLRAVELAIEAGIPADALAVLPGLGADVGEPLGLHEDIDCIAFTGSTGTAKRLLGYAGQSNMKRIYAETGGKSANLIFADAYDLDQAARAAAAGIFYNQGQVCIAASRLLVQESIAEDFIAKVIAAAGDFQLGDPLDPACTMGTLVDAEHKAKVEGMIARAIEEGSECLLDGRGESLNQIGPTIFRTQPGDSIACEEVFGPVLSVMTFRDEEEALALANSSIYGLGAAVWTSDLNRAHRVASRLKAGSVFVNNYNDGDMTVPWSGFKQSGNGIDKSLHALEKFSQIKTTWLNLG